MNAHEQKQLSKYLRFDVQFYIMGRKESMKKVEELVTEADENNTDSKPETPAISVKLDDHLELQTMLSD
eukprot:UN30070